MTKLFDIHADEPNGGGSFGVWSWQLRDQSPQKKKVHFPVASPLSFGI